MKKLFLALFILVATNYADAQYYEWAERIEDPSMKGSGCLDITTDKENNYYLLNYNCISNSSSGLYSFVIDKYSPNGTLLAHYGSPSFRASYGGYSFAIDSNKNIIVAGMNVHGAYESDVMFGKDSVHPGNNFIIKFDNTFKIKWVKQFVGYGPGDIVTDKNGSIYYTNGVIVEKRNTSGNIAWTNSNVGGNAICIDQNNKVYTFTSNLVTKLNNINGNVVWSKPSHNANYMAVRNNGEIFISNNDSLIKLDNSGNFVWNRKASGIIGITVDNLGRAFYIKDSLVERISNNGTKKQWSLNTEGGQFSIISLDRNDNAILGGTTKNQIRKAILCPFEILTYCPLINNFSNNLFLAKLNVNDVVPFQAGIFNNDLSYNTQYCVNEKYSVNFTYCTNSKSSFNPGNEFRVQISDSGGSFNNPIDIGKPDSIVIPKSVKNGYVYKIRVNSTNPVSNGYPNIPHENWNCFEFIGVHNNSSSLNSNGPVTYCNGGSVILNVITSADNLLWFKNDTLINWNSTSLTVTESGKFKVVATYSGLGCVDTTNAITVTVNPKPTPVITAWGPTTFCAGDSVLLVANAGLGYNYQWKVNGVGIPFAFNQTYVAKQAGPYKVRIIDSNGCSATSSAVNVNVPCKLNGNEVSNENEISIIPNISDGNFQVSLGNYPIRLIQFYDVIGNKLFERKVSATEPELSFNFEYFENGIYFVKFIGDGGTTCKKLTIQR